MINVNMLSSWLNGGIASMQISFGRSHTVPWQLYINIPRWRSQWRSRSRSICGNVYAWRLMSGAGDTSHESCWVSRHNSITHKHNVLLVMWSLHSALALVCQKLGLKSRHDELLCVPEHDGTVIDERWCVINIVDHNTKLEFSNHLNHFALFEF